MERQSTYHTLIHISEPNKPIGSHSSFFFFSSRRRHTRCSRDWSSDVCSSDLVGLSSAELHIARVRARVAKGGHDIPEPRIRDRYDRSRLNLIHLMARLTELREIGRASCRERV